MALPTAYPATPSPCNHGGDVTPCPLLAALLGRSRRELSLAQSPEAKVYGR